MTIVESLCFGGFALCWGLQQAPHTLAGPSVCWYMLGGWIIVIFFFKRVQKEEDKAAGWYHVFREEGRAEMCEISHETHEFPQSLSCTTEVGMRLYPNT